jgi:hypothetical protein
MAANKITYVDKETLTALPLIAEKNKITGDNATEIKTVVNSHADNIDILTANNHQQNTDTGTIIQQYKSQILDLTRPRKFGSVPTMAQHTQTWEEEIR